MKTLQEAPLLGHDLSNQGYSAEALYCDITGLAEHRRQLLMAVFREVDYLRSQGIPCRIVHHPVEKGLMVWTKRKRSKD